MTEKFIVLDWAGNSKPEFGIHSDIESAFEAITELLRDVNPGITDEDLTELEGEFQVLGENE